MNIGILGLGELGTPIAQSLAQLGFRVYGFSKRPKAIPGIHCFSAQEGEMSQFLAQVNCLVCLLPLTPETENILDQRLFEQLPDSAYLINVGRGKHLVDADLLSAIESGKIAGALLDVLRVEPLPKEHPFWLNSKIKLTPHIASISNQETIAVQIAENYRRLEEGQDLLHQVDLELGY